MLSTPPGGRLRGCRRARIGPHHFSGSTGYGHGDLGRAALDEASQGEGVPLLWGRSFGGGALAVRVLGKMQRAAERAAVDAETPAVPQNMLSTASGHSGSAQIQPPEFGGRGHGH